MPDPTLSSPISIEVEGPFTRPEARWREPVRWIVAVLMMSWLAWAVMHAPTPLP